MNRWRVALLAGVLVLLAGAQTSYYKPNWTLYSPQQDIELGQQAEAQALKQYPILHNSAAERYVTDLGQKLASHMPGPKFPFNFHVVNQKDINAFALPGGPVFVNVGAICAAKNEAQLAGIMAHEESHVALRHSSSMISKKTAASLPLSILGGIFSSGTGRLANAAAQLVVGGVFLKYSRDMESQADALGAQIMSASGYDPRQMAQFFETLEAQGGSGTVQFLSDHPNPGNRQAAIEAEIPTLGPHPPYQDNSAAFEKIHGELCNGSTPATSDQLSFQGFGLTLPQGWKAYGDQTSQLTLAPANGLSGSGDQTQILRGAIVGTFQGSRDQLIAQLQQSNPDMRPAPSASAQSVAAAGLRGSAVTLTNRNASGQPETDRLVVLPRPGGAPALYLIFIAPSPEYRQLVPAFDAILKSLSPPR